MPGSVETDQVLRLAGQSRKLMNELASELATVGIQLSKVSWSGSRLGRQWKYLGGSKVIPYECSLGGKTLTLDGVLRFFDDEGKYLAINNPKVHDEAMYIAEDSPSWTWSSKSRRKGKSKNSSA